MNCLKDLRWSERDIHGEHAEIAVSPATPLKSGAIWREWNVGSVKSKVTRNWAAQGGSHDSNTGDIFCRIEGWLWQSLDKYGRYSYIHGEIWNNRQQSFAPRVARSIRLLAFFCSRVARNQRRWEIVISRERTLSKLTRSFTTLLTSALTTRSSNLLTRWIFELRNRGAETLTPRRRRQQWVYGGRVTTVCPWT